MCIDHCKNVKTVFCAEVHYVMTKQQVRMGVAATLYVQRGMVHMKILQINSWFSQGGPPRVVNGIYDTLKEFGYECKIEAARS